MIARWFTSTAFLLLFIVQQTSAQHLPIRSYTPADGLPSSLSNTYCETRAVTCGFQREMACLVLMVIDSSPTE
jgi:hypothetical protein